MNYRAWQLKNADTAGESALLAAGYGPLLARVLACRGIAQPQAAAALLEEEPPLSDPVPAERYGQSRCPHPAGY